MGGACACARIQHFGAKMRFKRESDGEYIIIKQPMTVYYKLAGRFYHIFELIKASTISILIPVYD